MISNSKIGQRGEEIAVKYLLRCHFEILETNWRYKRAEIDIIARKDNMLIFVEVKTRQYTYYGEPSEFVTEKKETLVMDAAQRYMEAIDYNWEVRFDIISVILTKSGDCKKLDHFEDAFFA